MQKFCVFCGNVPIKKTNEHIVPRWLIELTGDSKRLIQIGPIVNESNKDKFIEFKMVPYDKFQFASCEDCNSSYSGLEASTKAIMIKILKETSLSFQEIHTLFSWFDKVRIGLWLASHYLFRNYFGIEPKFYITSRMEKSDRILLIYRTNEKRNILTFWGANTPAFQFAPCCFALIVNNFSFINMSKEFLLWKRLGSPYPTTRLIYDDKHEFVRMHKGRGKFKHPILNKKYNKNCRILFQPIFKDLIPQFPEFKNDENIRNLSHDFKKGIGNIYYYDSDILKKYNVSTNYNWKPENKLNEEKYWRFIGKQTLEFQNYFLETAPKYHKSVSSEKIKWRMEERRQSQRFNKTLITHEIKF